MELRKLSIENWRSISKLELNFDSGLNLLFGPNESGKSSIREAIHEAFTSACRPRGRSVLSQARPWGAGRGTFPVVPAGGHLWLVHRSFLNAGPSELWRDGVLLVRGDRMQSELAQQLQTKALSALWAVQGQFVPATVDPEIKASLATREAVAPGAAWLERTINERFEHFWTSERGQPRKEIRDARDRNRAAEQELQHQEAHLRELDDSMERAQELEDRLQEVLVRSNQLHSRREALRQQAQEAQRARDEQLSATRAEKERIENWLSRWEQHVARWFLIRESLAQFQARTVVLDQKYSELPADHELEKCRARLAFVRARIGILLKQSLDRYPPLLAEDLQNLANLENRAQLLAQALRLAPSTEQYLSCTELAAWLEDVTRAQQLLEEQVRELETTSQNERSVHMQANHLRAQTIGEVERAISVWTTTGERLLNLWPEHQKQQQRLHDIAA